MNAFARLAISVIVPSKVGAFNSADAEGGCAPRGTYGLSGRGEMTTRSVFIAVPSVGWIAGERIAGVTSRLVID